MNKKLLSIGALCIALGAQAGGFKTALQATKQIGMASCGTGLALDASSIYFNPGALAYSPNQLVVGFTGLMPRTQFLDASTQTHTNTVAKTFTPFNIFASYGITKKLVAGVGVYTPFGSGVEYPTGWTGRYALTEISLTNIFIKPTLSYKITNELSVGAGFIASIGNVNLEKDIPVQQIGSAEVGHAKLNGGAMGYGFDAGVYYTKDKWSGGITYRSKVTMNVDKGTNTFTNIPVAAQASFPDGTFTSALPLPGEVSFGIGYKATKKLLLAFDVNYTMWSAYDSLRFDFATNTASLPDVQDARIYEDAATFRVGAQYMINKKVTVRGGALYDATPVSDGYVTPESPDANRYGFAFGASYVVNNKISIDAGFMYQNVNSRLQTNVITGLSGTFTSKVIAPSIGVVYNFKAAKPKPVTPTTAK
jgi:long-chain fatty acid transport protein